MNGLVRKTKQPCRFARNGHCKKPDCEYDHKEDAPHCSKCGRTGHEYWNCKDPSQNQSLSSSVASIYDAIKEQNTGTINKGKYVSNNNNNGGIRFSPNPTTNGSKQKHFAHSVNEPYCRKCNRIGHDSWSCIINNK